ncbi:MAG: hypothetical protein GEU74_11800 [Nitriliruptorales bacterium]|nr:hypothetical protein [Nitriliruptorales bacterium]
MTDQNSGILPGLDPDVRERVVTVEAVTTNIGKMKHAARCTVSSFTVTSHRRCGATMNTRTHWTT